VSCKAILIESIIPISPIVNRKINPIDPILILVLSLFLYSVVIHLKTLILVGIAIIIITDAKYARACLFQQ